jgi:acyl-coenzyme A synthetase/AMP-(fatty) acid ligase
MVLPRRTIPRTENGKIRHGQLRDLLEQNDRLEQNVASRPAG